ncbi:uroporphyrinogen-III synthase [Kushneria phosphatilytica]|uniref:uroporphyrinogen-III synthase n=1 Tax=Kushneria phosphatilytica TaxID=657387 RepID=UPI000A71419D|nr:uroporphyrinogen-III synthase [Kushneria phosphatilytica]
MLIARPGARAQALIEALEQRAFTVRSLDIMQLEACSPTPAERSLLYDLDQFAVVICTSPFAAECLSEAIEHRWPQLPIGPRFLATGASTAEVLGERLGIEAGAPPRGSGSASEALLAMPELQTLTHQRVLLAAGEGGRTVIERTLADRGARVERLALYRRTLHPPRDEARRCLAAGRFQALLVTSAEQLEHLQKWCTDASRSRPLIVSSERLATLAHTYRFSCVSIAGDATPATLAAAVAGAQGGTPASHHDERASDT